MIPEGRRWWVLRHRRAVTLWSILLIFLLPVLFFFTIAVVSLTFLVFAAFIFLFTVNLLGVFQGFAYSRLYRVIMELQPPCVVENFDPLRLTIEIKRGTRTYFIKLHANMTFHSLLMSITKFGPEWNTPPDHYQVWTPLAGWYGASKRRYDYMEYVRTEGILRLFSGLISSRQKQTVFDETVQEQVPHLHDEAIRIQSFWFMGYAVEKGETILFALLTRSADVHDISHTLQLLMRTADEMEQPSPCR